MAIDHLSRQCEALLDRHIRQADQSSVWDVMQINQLPEVRIYCDQNAIFRVCKFQQGQIPRIRAESSSFEHVMSLVAQPLRQPASRATVYQKPHDPATEMEARVSLAMTACA